MKGVVVLSGGMDSAVALQEARADGIEVIKALHFQYGSKHNKREEDAAYNVAHSANVPLEVVKLPFIGELFKSDLLLSGKDVPEGHYADDNMKRTVVPFRNGIMLAIAAGYAESIGAHCVILGNHKGDHAVYPDCRPEFTNAMDDAIRLGTYAPITLVTPLGDMTKAEIAQRGIVLGVRLNQTYSCYKGGEIHCGKCGTCVERIEAFRGLKDPTEYEDTSYAKKLLGWEEAFGDVPTTTQVATEEELRAEDAHVKKAKKKFPEEAESLC